MLFKGISVLNEDFSVTQGLDLRTEGSLIASITGGDADGPCAGRSGCPAKGPSLCLDNGPVIDGRGKLLMPGFYNAHGHAPMTIMRGYGENMALMDWLTKKITPFEDRLTGPDCYHATLLTLAESFSQGIVSSSDQYLFCEDIVRAAAESGAKLNASRGLALLDREKDINGFRPFQESKKLFESCHETSEGRIRVDIGLHAEYTATAGLIEAVAGLVNDTGAPVHVHVSETRGEHEQCKERNGGRTPARVLADGGVFSKGGYAAHCVWVEEEDADIFAENGVTVVSCPVSNMKLASGIARVPLLLEKGVNVALGTDGAASNNSMDFFEEMKLLALSAKARFGDPALITPREALYAATRAGALAQGRMDCGYIKEGFRADMVVVDLASPSMNPVFDMANSLVFSAGGRDILMTVVDGLVVYEKGAFPTIDMEKTIYEVESARRRILGELEAGAK